MLSEPGERYSRLAPLTIHERIRISLAALTFFSVPGNAAVRQLLGESADEQIRPLSGFDFLRYIQLTVPNFDPHRVQQRIGELLRSLEHAGLLTNVGKGRGITLGDLYYNLQERTNLERQGICWLARALGAEFIHFSFEPVTMQLTGISRKTGGVTAGTGIAIAPTWVLTCAHVLNEMRIDEDQASLGHSTKVIRSLAHPTLDVGLVELSGAVSQLLGLSFRDPIIAEPVFTLGYPRVPQSRSASLVMQRGEITSTDVTLFNGHRVFLYSAIARPGNSGGPVISATGHVVGIVTEELVEQGTAESMPFHAGITASEIARALADLDAPVPLPIEDYK